MQISPAMLKNYFHFSNKKRAHVLTLVAALMGALVFVFPQTWFLAPVSLAALFLSIQKCDSRNDAFVCGFIYGTVTGGASIWWAWDALPFLWLGYTSPFDGAYVMAIIWDLVSLGLGVSIALYAALMWELRTSHLYLLVAALLWPAAEWGRMWFFSLLAIGEHSLLGPHFSFAAIGYAFAETPALVAAERGGVYALCFLVALCAVTLIYLLETRVLYAGLCVLALSGMFVSSTPRDLVHEPATLALIHTVRHDNPYDVTTYTNVLASAEKPAILIVPEDLYMFGTSTLAETLARTKALPETLIAFPNREQGEGHFYRNTVMLAQDGVELARFTKRFLMPEGEYSPYLSQWIFKIIDDPRVSSYFSSTQRMFQGSPEVPITYRGFSVRGLMCSDIISPLVARMDGESGPRIMINIGDQTWFNVSPLLHQRLVAMARVRAVENNAYVAVANRGSPSYVVDPRGTLVGESVWGEEGILYVELR